MMLQLATTKNTPGALFGSTVCVTALLTMPTTAATDEAGISFWIPGQFGSLAAAPQQPGWSFADTYFHDSVSAGGDIALARQVELGALSRTATLNLNLNANISSRIDLDFATVGYVFATPVLGGQLGVSMVGGAGSNSTSINGTLTASLGPFTATRFGSLGDARDGFTDLYPMATLRWNAGVNNFMVYDRRYSGRHL